MLLLGGSGDFTLAIGPLSATTSIRTVVECACKLTGTALQHRGDGNGTVCRGNGWCFGHEIEVQELDQLKLHFSACFAGLEEACDCQEAIEVFKGTSILRGFDQSAYEGYDRRGLDGRAVDRLEEVEEVLIREVELVFKNWQSTIGLQTFIYSSLENKLLEGGCSSIIPWIRSSV